MRDKILLEGDSRLRQVCAPVDNVDGRTHKLIKRLNFVCRMTPDAAGVAAPQIGVGRRVFNYMYRDQSGAIINPEIRETAGSIVIAEFCLSVPDRSVEIERPESMLVVGLDQDGEEVEMELHGFMARLFFHEIDHLDGKLVTDYLEPRESL